MHHGAPAVRSTAGAPQFTVHLIKAGPKPAFLSKALWTPQGGSLLRSIFHLSAKRGRKALCCLGSIGPNNTVPWPKNPENLHRALEFLQKNAHLQEACH